MTEEEKDLTPQIFLNNEKFNIPEEGMLGLLALGDVGLKMWRKKRKEMEESRSKPAGNSETKTTNHEPPSTN